MSIAGRVSASNVTRNTADEELGIVVVSSRGQAYRARVDRARETWAKEASVVFVSGGSAGLNDEVNATESVPCGDDHLQGMCCKTLYGLRLALMRFPSAQWLLRVVDDTFVFVRHLLHELGAFQASRLIYAGSPSVSLLCHFALHAGNCAEAHAAGGAGVVLSRPLAQQLVWHGTEFLRDCYQDDVHLGHFLRHRFDVHVIGLPGALQEPRLASVVGLRPGLSRWAIPLPAPTYARLDDHGLFSPFAPLDAKRLVLIHSDPSVWPELQRLSAVASAFPPPWSLLAFYAPGDPASGRSRRVMGPRYEGGGGLGVCLLSGEDRSLSFYSATLTQPELVEAVPALATLHWAAWHGHASVIQELSAYGTNLNVRRVRAPVQEEFAALHVAATKGHVAAVDALITARADVDARGTLSGWTPLDAARFARHHGYAGPEVEARLVAASAHTSDELDVAVGG
eukprot:TRINITY_DN18273_c0_g1_i2.p1 TRINITY_DN18273_c0_g1~~TRINITY_DN18273_c0_g1_i2.p1  ORF type:complete len:454 (-),score=71.59 TRINITY_DN18273_c0_g1_i2:284-1645(-)